MITFLQVQSKKTILFWTAFGCFVIYWSFMEQQLSVCQEKPTGENGLAFFLAVNTN